MIITNALVYEDAKSFSRRDLVIRNGMLVPDTQENRDGESQSLDGSGCYAIPGLLDLHFHGAMNRDVCDAVPEAFDEIAQYEAQSGVTAICPATLTLPVETLEQTLRTGAAFAKSSPERKGSEYRADLVGFNMEGPFISRAKKGAQNENYILPCSRQIVDRFLEASEGLVKIIGLAPEENPGYESYIPAVKDRVRVSLAHTNAEYETAKRAFDLGASHAVHIYNAMTGLDHRSPGVVGAVSDSPHVTAEIICDGIHVHPAAVRAAFRMMGEERMILISDSLRCTGMPDGEYVLGGQEITKRGPYCRLKGSGAIAGSVSNLMECMTNAVKTMGIPLETAVSCASAQPAAVLGVQGAYGSLVPGHKGHVVLLSTDNALETVHVIKDGIVIR